MKQKLLIKELHAALKHLYTEQVIPHLHSCIDEILTTSILRFEQMQIVEVTSYGNKTGSNTNFLLSGKEMRTKLLETLDFFIPLRKFNEKQSRMVDDEI